VAIGVQAGKARVPALTPKHLRLRKKILDENQRKRAQQNRVVKVMAA
jgi:hypothetical protein